MLLFNIDIQTLQLIGKTFEHPTYAVCLPLMHYYTLYVPRLRVPFEGLHDAGYAGVPGVCGASDLAA